MGSQSGLCVLFRPFSYEEKENTRTDTHTHTHKQNPQKILEKFCLCVFLFGFSLPIHAMPPAVPHCAATVSQHGSLIAMVALPDQAQ